MPHVPRSRIATDQLQATFAQRQREVGHTLEQTSAVPPALFGTQDPLIEAKLLDEALVQLLRHLESDVKAKSAAMAPPPAVEVSRDPAVTTEEIGRLLAEFASDIPEPAPDLLEGLTQERFWILADIAKCGSGLARQRATVELRAAISDLTAREEVDESALRALVRMLSDASHRTDMPVLFRTLHLAANRALQQRRQAKPVRPMP